MKRLIFNKKSICNILFIILAVIILLLLFTPDFNVDEPFTISLIKHNYDQIININSFDVHPPFYYLILKLFLNITTFWTRSIYIKILFARVFSFIIFLISFYFLIRIVKILGVHVHIINQLIFFFIFPCISQYSMTIRMYQLSAMFITLEIYGNLLFEKGKKYGLVISTISIILSMYTNYFTALFAGAFIFIELCRYILIKDYKKFKDIFLTVIIDIFVFIPYLPYLLRQVHYVESNQYSNYVGIPNFGHNILLQLLGAFSGKMFIGSINSLLIIIATLFVESLCLWKINKKHDLFSSIINRIILAFILGFLPSIILSFYSHPIIISRYGYPVFFILYFLFEAYILNFVNYNFPKVNVLLLIVFLLIINIPFIKGLVNTNEVSYKGIRTEKYIINSRQKYININGYKAVECASYLPNNSNKKIKSKDINIKSFLGSDNRKLFYRVFSNIKD